MKQDDRELSSNKPYLLRAFYDWITDNECTPYIVVDADARDVDVPYEYVEEGRIVLNIASQAVSHLQMTNNSIEFEARFNGVLRQIYVPVYAVLAVYAFENGHGMVFAEDETKTHSSNEDAFLSEEESRESALDSGESAQPGKPTLRIVK